MLEHEVKKEKITRRNFLSAGIEILGGVAIAAPIIYFIETENMNKKKQKKENLILRGYSPEVAEEIVKGKRFYLSIENKEKYYKIRGKNTNLTYEEWLKKYDESLRISMHMGVFQDKFGKNYFRKLTKQELKEFKEYRYKRKLMKENK